MVGIGLALCRVFSPYIVLPVLVIPCAYTMEFITTGVGRAHSISRLQLVGRLAVVGLLAVLLAGLSFWSISGGSPTVMRPLPFLSVILALFEFPLVLIFGVPSIAFMATVTPNVWLCRDGLPVRFHFLLIVSTIATAYWFIVGWEDANRYQSHGYAVGVTTVNLVGLVILWIAAWALRNSRNFYQKLGFAMVLFVWLFAFAFPWMGELP